MEKLLFLDVEWANPKHKSICQIAIIVEDLQSGTILVEEGLFINPEDTFDPYCVGVHHITNEMTYDAINFKEFWDKFGSLFSTSIVVGHNVRGADIDAISKNLLRYNLSVPEMYYIDTQTIAKRVIETESYRLSDLCYLFGIKDSNHHDALNDTRCDRELFKELINRYNVDFNEYVGKYESKEFKDSNLDGEEDYDSKTNRIQKRKHLNYIDGFITGILSDGEVSLDEIEKLKKYYHSKYAFKFDESLKSINRDIEKIIDGKITKCIEFEKVTNKINLIIEEIPTSESTSGTQFLKMLVEGINCDEVITDGEIIGLKKWLDMHTNLQGHFPYNNIYSLINDILLDNIITEEEKQRLAELFKIIENPVDNSKKNNLEIYIPNKCFCLTGDFKFGTKNDVEKLIIANGGIIDKSVKKSTSYVVIGEYGSLAYANGNYGSKVKIAMEKGIPVIKEEELMDILNRK